MRLILPFTLLLVLVPTVGGKLITLLNALLDIVLQILNGVSLPPAS